MTTRVSSLLIGFFAVVAALGLALTAARAAAVFEDIAETGRPGYLRLSIHSETPLWAEIAPGESMRWLVEASLFDAPAGRLEVELQATSAHADFGGLTAEIVSCSGRFELAEDAAHEASACSGRSETVLAEAPLVDAARNEDRYELLEIARGEPRELLVTLRLPASADGESTGSSGIGGLPDAETDAETGAAESSEITRLGLGVHASGEQLPPPPEKPPLPTTGADLLPLALLAAGLIGVGAVLALRRRGSGARAAARDADPDRRSADTRPDAPEQGGRS